jgi:plastocyanin
MNKQTKVWLVLSIVLSLLALGSACGKSEGPSGPATNESAGAGPYSGPTGTVSGVISFTGTPPAPKKIDTAADPVCGQANPNLTTEDTVVKDGKLANVFVYIQESTGAVEGGKKLTDYTWATPTTAVQLDQNGCHYRPHILGVQTNQKINITNSDHTQHNIHWTPKQNPEWNQSQPNGAPPIEKSFNRAEVLVPVKCNQHPWMRAYIGVMRTPFFSVSGENGAFEIKNVPAGKYTVIAWREGGTAGTEQKMEVTVPANGSAKADFSFGAAAASVNTSLQMMPALEIPAHH